MKESKFTQSSFHLARQTLASRAIFSKHTFTQPQLLTINTLRIRPYREFTELLQGVSPGKKPKLKYVLHFTTIQKAFTRLATAMSGYEQNYASHYYTMRTRLKLSSIKTTLLVDLGEQVVLDILMTTTRKHDTQIAPSLIRRNRNSFQILTADKGYEEGIL